MTKFFITTKERRQAQVRAAELDIEKSDPPGQTRVFFASWPLEPGREVVKKSHSS